MLFKFAILVSLLTSLAAGDETLGFVYNGFQSANLSLDGVAEFTSNGLLRLTNNTAMQKGHAFYPNPISFKNSSNGSAFSYSTTFVFAIHPSQHLSINGHGMAFVIAPTRGLPDARGSQYLGLFNEQNRGNDSNHVFAVELDTTQSPEFSDINDNHVGIDINDLKSKRSAPAGYHENRTGEFKNLTLISGKRMQVWVEYNGDYNQINVTLAPFNSGKPSTPLLSLPYDLSPVFNKAMYVGFSSSTVSGVVYVIRRKRKFAEVLEDWELEYGPQRFKYKDLYIATKGFREKELLGTGGFGRVYRGVLPKSKLEIAVKKISHESRQGMREFIAEIVSIGHLRHRNLVQLLGYCRRKGELLLVYDYMCNGSLDKYLYDQPKITLDWRQRFQVIKGVALGLFYLHEGWEKVVIHRDVKASNVLLDAELNARLGDFGLARLYDHGTDPQTTHVVGTIGYLAPEHTRTGKATRSTDVFSFGTFLLEVVCGRRPIEPRPQSEDVVILVDWVFSYWCRGEILEARDPNLGTDFVTEDLELVLKLGLMCSHAEPTTRPSMRQVIQYLEKDVPLPELSSLGISAYGEGFDDPSSSTGLSGFSSIAGSVLSGGR